MWQTSPEPEPRTSWLGIVQAAVAAVLVVGLLAGGVVLAWSTGSGPARSATLAPEVPPTPTPRVLAFNPQTTEPDVTTSANTPDPEKEPEAPATDAGGLVIVATPEMMSLNAGADAEREPAGKILYATTMGDFKKLANASWRATRDGLENSGDQAVAARWLTLAEAPGPGFVVEAEMRVTSTLPSVCDQSFGITGGSTTGRQEALATLPANDPQRAKLEVYQIGCDARDAKIDEVVKKLEGVIVKTEDPSLKALAYNTLGDCYVMKGNKQDAKFAYLWVDAVYNQDRAEHAKALERLANLFQDEALNDPDRAAFFRDKAQRVR
jgi:hypothetical protein